MCKFFNKFFKILQKSLINKFLLNVFPNRNFGDAIAVQNLSRICLLNFVRPSLNPNPGAAFNSHPDIMISHDWSYWHFCIQICSSIKFYSVIFCIFYSILYFTTFKKIRFPRSKILEPLLNISTVELTS